MVILIVNPIVVTLTFTQDQLGIPIVTAQNDDNETVATITVAHVMQGSKLIIRDHRIDIAYESSIIDKEKVSNTNYLFQLIERMLNELNLTHIQRIPESDNPNPSS